MLMFCDPADCYDPYCLERGFQTGRSLQGDSQQRKSPGPDGPVHFQLPSDTHHFSGGKGPPELHCRLLQHRSGNLWHGLIKTWGSDPSTCHLPLCSPTQEPRHQGDTGHCCAHCTGRDTEFPNPFLKDTIFHGRNAVMILKDSPSELKGRHSMFRYLPKSHKQLFFRLTPAIPPDSGQNGTAGYLSSCLSFRRALFLLTWWYFHLNCIAPSRCRLHDRPNAQHYCT